MNLSELRQRLTEAAVMKDEMNPPAMLVLKRKGIRIFPDGTKVAMYINEKLNLTFTVPYDGKTQQNRVIPGSRLNEEKPGLWANIRKRREKGLPPRKPGQKGAPDQKSWDAAAAASKKKD
jgi:hypothetical protein